VIRSKNLQNPSSALSKSKEGDFINFIDHKIEYYENLEKELGLNPCLM
jgi:hypothetical protein